MKTKVALLAGGYSGESVISYKSAQQVADYIPKEKYEVFVVDVQKDNWIYRSDKGDFFVNKDHFSLMLPSGEVRFDIAFDMIHGTPGENGMMQSYLEMLGIAHTTCKSSVAALTFNKFYCNSVIRQLGFVNVAQSVHCTPRNVTEKMEAISSLKFPLFVKPAAGGSSIGMSKVYNDDELSIAIKKAFQEDGEVLVEEFIAGKELTCGILQSGETFIPLSITEIRSTKDFFDYEAKYQNGLAEEITPAPISEELSSLIKETSLQIYKALDCFGVCRFDYIWTGEQLYFLEVNTIPGMSAQSIVPAQAKHAGYSLEEFVDLLLSNGIKRKF